MSSVSLPYNGAEPATAKSTNKIAGSTRRQKADNEVITIPENTLQNWEKEIPAPDRTGLLDTIPQAAFDSQRWRVLDRRFTGNYPR